MRCTIPYLRLHAYVLLDVRLLLSYNPFYALYDVPFSIQLLYGLVFLIISNCFSTRVFASIKRSTQFCMHGSSYLSNFPCLMVEVMHLRKQMSV